jgi:hypothetical protein
MTAGPRICCSTHAIIHKSNFRDQPGRFLWSATQTGYVCRMRIPVLLLLRTRTRWQYSRIRCEASKSGNDKERFRIVHQETAIRKRNRCTIPTPSRSHSFRRYERSVSAGRVTTAIAHCIARSGEGVHISPGSSGDAGADGFANLSSLMGTFCCICSISMVKCPLGRAMVQRNGVFTPPWSR